MIDYKIYEYQIEDKHYNDGKPFTIHSPLNQEHIMDQFGEIFAEGHYEAGKTKKNMIIIDCGANCGLASLYFEDNAKTIYALEPSAPHYEALIKNVKDHPKVKPFNIGISSQTTMETLKSNGDGTVPESFFGDGKEEQRTSFLTMEDFFKQEKVEHVDLLKMDTEGAEYIILPSNGFRNVVDRIDTIIGEAHYFGDLIPQFIPEILKEYGFTTTFLDFENINKELHLKNSMEEHHYHVNLKTLFFATRKDTK